MSVPWSSVRCCWLVLLAALKQQQASDQGLQAEVVLSGPFKKRTRFGFSVILCPDRDPSKPEKFLDYLF